MTTLPPLAFSPPRELDAVRAKLRWVFCFPVVMGALLVVGAYHGALINFLPKWEGDIWWHIAVGEHILSKGIWPTSDFLTAHGALLMLW